MQVNNQIYRSIVVVLSLTMFYACSVKKYMPKDELLYRGGKVTVEYSEEIDNKYKVENELQDLLFPKPNTRFLGLYPGLHYHLKAERKEKPNFILRFLDKKIGEKPAYLSDVRIENTEDLIENRLRNNGFFQSEISSVVLKDSTAKTAKTNFKVLIGRPYVLENYTIEIDSNETENTPPIYEEIRKSLNETILKKESRYDLGSFKAERERIDQYLKERGYYNFSSNFILFQADTNLNNNKHFNLYLKLKEGVPLKSKVPYILDKVKIFPNITKDTSNLSQDTTIIDNISFIQGKVFFKPKRLRPFILLEPGQLYNPIKSKHTSQRLSSIGTFKFVNIDYEEVDSVGTDNLRYLNATISLSPLTKRAIRADLQVVTKSNNFTGPNLGLTYINRNLFKGGETFSTTGSFGFEKQFGNKTNGSSSLQLGLSVSLMFPRLIFPGNLDKYFRYSAPKTKISISADYFRRTNLYSLNSYLVSFGYIWNANRYVSHLLEPVKINYLQLSNRSDQFNDILDNNPLLKRSFEQQFIAGLTYTFNYNELINKQQKGRFNIKFNFDIAGNTLSLFGKKQGADSTKSFLNLTYAQYVKGDLDLSYHYDITPTGHTLIGRVFGGIGIPYGNSQALPYVKQYFSGGSYSVRAFQIRGLGPGTYNPTDNSNLYFDRSGDIRLEANLEYRFPIVSILKGALFADAGNIWNLTDNLPGGKFTSDFMNQIAVGAGVGIRLDVQGIVIRFDVAAPIKHPAGSWEFDYKNPAFNFAIGYPF